MTMPKLIACDVDGTLLFDYAPTIPSSTLQVIGQLIDRGIEFVPASGRAYGSLRRLFAPYADKISFIAENGTIAYRGDEVVFRSTMDRSLGESLIKAMLATDDCEAMVSGARTSYIQPKSPDFPAFLRDVVGFDITIVDDLTAIDEPFTKISAYYPSRIVNEEYWRSQFGGQCEIATAGYGWIDMMPTGTNKSAALAAILELLGISSTDIVAFGDARNDCEMLQLAGYSVAMKAGDPRTIAVANRTAPNAESELRKFLK